MKRFMILGFILALCVVGASIGYAQTETTETEETTIYFTLFPYPLPW